jgi:hypothetical protein
VAEGDSGGRAGRAATEGLMAASLDNLADYLRTERQF